MRYHENNNVCGQGGLLVGGRKLLAVAVTAFAASVAALAPSVRADEPANRATIGPGAAGPTSRPTPEYTPKMSPFAKEIGELNPGFSPDPTYTGDYGAQEQLDIYGAKHPNKNERPPVELGQPLFDNGPYDQTSYFLGEKNPVYQHLWVFGDWRNVIAANRNGNFKKADQDTVATRLNLDIDYQFTSTERIHALIRPLDKNGSDFRYDFGGADTGFKGGLDGNIDALFFEGDAGAITQGFTNTPSKFDMPFTVGRIPLLFQNGVWMNDAIDGFAFTIPSRNSPALGISNMDITFFAGFDHITSGALIQTPAAGANKFVNDKFILDQAEVFGVASFIEASEGYYEIDYGYTDDRSGRGQSYHNFSAAFTKRYFNIVSNSIRAIFDMGQNPTDHNVTTADGFVIILENSFMTGQSQQTLVPYLNGWVGVGHPQSVARDAGAGGLLVNEGILFQPDGVTKYPTLDATANNTAGAALGVEYLFDLHQQIILETAAVIAGSRRDDRSVPGNELGFSVRYQIPINNAMLIRADWMYGFRQNANDLAGFRIEFRWKF